MVRKLLLIASVSWLVFMPLKNLATIQKEQRTMDLGNFSVSLAVKDIEASKSFYEKLGFKVFMGNAAQKWLIMKNGDRNIGLFQGMFDKNILTFNPGWDSNAQNLREFTDIRELQRQLKANRSEERRVGKECRS